jgi:hypothetical protein
MDKSREGVLVRIRGERGTFKVRYEAVNGGPHGVHIALFGGPYQHFRNVRPDAVVWPTKRRTRRTEEH